MANRFNFDVKSLRFKRQVDLTTENTSTTATDCLIFPPEVATITFGRDVEDLQLAHVQVGSFETPAIGGKKLSFTAKYPMRGYKAAYDYAVSVPGTDADTIAPEMILLAVALGSAGPASCANAADLNKGKNLKNVAYNAGDVAGASTTAIATTAGTYTPGALWVSDDAVPIGVPTIGWIKNQVVQLVTLFEAAANSTGAGDNVLPTSTAYLSDLGQIPLTCDVLGAQANEKIALIGLTVNKIEISLVAGKTPMVTLTFEGVDFKHYSSGGGSINLLAYARAYPLMGAYAGRLTLGSTVTDGVSDLKIDIALPTTYVESHNANQGKSEAMQGLPVVHVDCAIPWSSADAIVSGENVWSALFIAGTAKSLNVMSGKAAGSIFAAFLPAMHLYQEPAMEKKGSHFFWKLAFRPSSYFADGTALIQDTLPGDDLLRIGIA